MEPAGVGADRVRTAQAKLVEHALGRSHRVGGERRDAPREPGHERVQVSVRQGPVDPAVPFGHLGAAISSWTRAPGTRRSPWSVLGGQGGGEKVDEQLVDAFVLVVMDPVRGVGQALDAVEVGHVVVVRLG